MPPPNTSPSFETITLAEKLLAALFGGRVRLDEGEDLGGSKRTSVARFKILEGPGNVPASVIVKHAHSTNDAVYDPQTGTIPAWTFLNEWASLQFLGQITAHEA